MTRLREAIRGYVEMTAFPAPPVMDDLTTYVRGNLLAAVLEDDASAVTEMMGWSGWENSVLLQSSLRDPNTAHGVMVTAGRSCFDILINQQLESIWNAQADAHGEWSTDSDSGPGEFLGWRNQ